MQICLQYRSPCGADATGNQSVGKEGITFFVGALIRPAQLLDDSVNVYDVQSGSLKFAFNAYDPAFLGGVRVAAPGLAPITTVCIGGGR